MNDAREAARAVAQLWAMVHADMPPGLRTRSDVRRLDSCVRELQAAHEPPPLDDEVRNDRQAVIRERIADLDSTPQWVAKFPRLEGESDD